MSIRKLLRRPAWPHFLLVLLVIPPVAAGVAAQDVVVDPGSGGVDGLTFPVSPAIVDGNPAIAYSDDATLGVKYVRATDADGVAWGAPVMVDATTISHHPLLQVVNGNPAVCYIDGGKSKLIYRRALDAKGEAWGAPVVLFNGNSSYESGMDIVEGNPAVCFTDISEQTLRYVRALDTSGTAWGPSVRIATPGPTIRGLAMKAAAGRPAIVYADESGLTYLRASDVAGTSWSGVQISDVTSVFTWGNHAAMEIVNDRPAVCYYDPGSGRLRYRRALDAAGAAWGEPVTFSSEVNPFNCSLAVVQGKPAISCFSGQTAPVFNFLHALDGEGATAEAWALRTVVNDGGAGTALHVVNDRPAFASYGSGNSLRFFRALDAAGSASLAHGMIRLIQAAILKIDLSGVFVTMREKGYQ